MKEIIVRTTAPTTQEAIEIIKKFQNETQSLNIQGPVVLEIEIK